MAKGKTEEEKPLKKGLKPQRGEEVPGKGELLFDEFFADGQPNQIDRTMQSQFIHETGFMVIHRVGRQMHLFSTFFDCQTPCQMDEHFHFATAKPT